MCSEILTVVCTRLHIPNLRRIRLWNFARRGGQSDFQLRGIKIMDCRLFVNQSLGSNDSILDEMAGSLNSVSIGSVNPVHGGGVR